MATATILPAVQRQSFFFRAFARAADSRAAALVLGTTTAFLLLGYHPYAEDGGIYAAALAARLDPSLFPAEHGFALAHTGRSLFVPSLTLLARIFHLTFPSMLLLAYITGLAATVAAGQSLAKVLFPSRASQRWAMATLAVALGLPVAGTSLYLCDPHLTARSLSTPMLLWALSLLLQRRTALAAGCLLVSFALHPMMTATSGVLFVCVLALRSSRRTMWLAVLMASVLTSMALLRFLSPANGEAVRAASISRAYWFPSQWAWYEVAGVVAPLLLLPAMAYRRSFSERMPPAARQLALAATLSTTVVCMGVLVFVHPGNGSMLLARMQPLRLLHTVYLVFVLLLGGLAGGVRIFRRVQMGWAVCALGAIGLFAMQRDLYPHSGHVELPWRTPANGYAQAFLWAREHTPADALFALDASYTTAHGEDAQLFRAIALRSSLPDAAKDGGIASVMPSLAPEWQTAAQAQAGFALASDAERLARVRPLGATWTVLPLTATTHFDCPYANNTAKVCRLP